MLSRRDDSHTRKIAVLFSDGLDTISLNSYADALNAALNDDVAIYSVDLSNSSHASAGARVLGNLATGTGGRYFSLQSSPSTILDAILQDFHSTYTVAYKLPSHAAGFHLVRILPTHNPELQFHCRSGYFYSSDSQN
jgi:Ca-activated chloride channel family protein